MIRWILLLGFFFFLGGCETEPTVNAIDGEPKIYFKGQLAGDYQDWSAGVGGLYDFTFSEQNEMGFYSLHSKLQNIDEEGAALEIILLDNSNPGPGYNPEDRFEKGRRSYMRQSDAIKSYTYQFHSEHLDDYIFDYQWLTSSQTYGMSQPEITFDAAGSQLICLKGQTYEGDTIHTCKQFNIDQNRWMEPRLEVKEYYEDSIFLISEVEGKDCDEWEWNGDSSEGYYFGMSINEWLYEDLTLRMSKDGKIVSDIDFRGEMDDTGNPSVGWVKFEQTMIHRAINDPAQHSKVIINYYHPENGLFSSKYAENQEYFFEIIEQEEFEVNENGEPTRLLTLEFQATLKSEFGEQMIISSDSCKLAFPNPVE
jgi:hypothetical protein